MTSPVSYWFGALLTTRSGAVSTIRRENRRGGPATPHPPVRPRDSLGTMSPETMFRLHRLRLKNYRSIKICNLSLGPLTLLVGPNGSGKSNVLDALGFTSQAPGENLDNALRERGGIAEVRRRSTGHPTHFSIAMTFVMGAGRQAGEYEFEIGAAKGGEYRPRVPLRKPGDQTGRPLRLRSRTPPKRQETARTAHDRVVPGDAAPAEILGAHGPWPAASQEPLLWPFRKRLGRSIEIEAVKGSTLFA